MGFKFKSLHISIFAVIVAISLGLAYMLYRRYSNSKEGFDNTKTTIVTEEEWRRRYPKDMSLADAASDFFKKYGAAPYSDDYNGDKLLEGVDLDTAYAFANRFGQVYMYNNKVLPRNPNMEKFLKKIGWTTSQVNPPFLGSDKKIHILDDDEVAKKIFSQFTLKSGSMSNNNSNPSQSSGSMVNSNSSTGQDNYNHFTGTSIPTMFYGPNGSTAKISNQGGVYSVIVSDKDGTNVVYDEQNKSLLSPSNLAAVDMVIDKIVDVVTRVQKASSNASTSGSTNASTSGSTNALPTKSDSVMKYYGPNGSVALMYTDSDGNTNLKLIDGTGKEVAYSSANMQSYNPSVDNPNVQQTMGSPTSPNKMNVSSNYKEAYTQSLTGPDYSSSLPKGIPKNMIPPGNEDLYILKSEVVPPVCPACPPPILKCNDDKPPPPCPPCARCPEPQFDCKKVPNYGSGNLGANYFGGGGQFGSMPSTSGNFLPFPSVSNYSTFGN
jgi:hypothetical protein